ncbi:MAG: META domain-containing protein [Chloroflexota bacterium]
MTRYVLGVRGQVAVVALLLAAAAAACLPGDDDNANGGLANTAWTVVSIAGTSTVPGAEPTMAFAPEGIVSGSDGCNAYTGPFRTDGDRITVGRLASTLIGCEPLLGAQAQAFSQALMGATTWRLTQTGTLEIRGPGDLVAEPLSDEPGPGGSPGIVGDLAGTSWVLAEIPTAPIVDTIPTLDFGADGTVSGFAGCNTFNGTYQADESSIAFGPLATTKIGCPDPTMLVERAYLAALASATSWRIGEAGRLVLEGGPTLAFGPG